MKRIHAVIVAIFALLAACGGGAKPNRPASGATLPTSTQIVYETDARNGPPYVADLWRFDMQTGTITRITSDHDKNFESMPRFHGTAISYITDILKRIAEFDPTTGKRSTVLRVKGALLAYAWFGEKLAYIEVNYETNSIHYLRVLDTKTRRITTLKKLGTPLGRGTGYTDVLSLAWSKDGSRILLTDSHLDEFPTVRIVGIDGRDKIPPIKGATNALWSHDEKSLYLRYDPHASKRAMWARYDLSDGTINPIHLPETAHHASLSPDGKTIIANVYDEKTATYGIWILDLASATSSSIAIDAVDAVWVTSTSFIATRVQPCRAGSCGENTYRGVGTSLYSLDDSSSKLAMVSTLWDGVGRRNTDLRTG